MAFHLILDAHPARGNIFSLRPMGLLQPHHLLDLPPSKSRSVDQPRIQAQATTPPGQRSDQAEEEETTADMAFARLAVLDARGGRAGRADLGQRDRFRSGRGVFCRGFHHVNVSRGGLG
jgi:hypothetical protein